MPFSDAAAQAIEAADKDMQNETSGTETAAGDNSDQENSHQKQAGSPDEGTQAKASNQAILDLAKVEKFVVDGQEMTFDELKKAMLRQQDYTKKTQTLAEERKFIDNLDADLSAVKMNPALAAQFKQIYPARFHRYLDLISGDQQSMSKAEKAEAKATLPPEVLEKLEQYEQRFQALDQEKMAAQQEQLTNFWDGLEQPTVKKYPYADLVHVYGMLENYIQENNLGVAQILGKREVSQQLFEHFAKASHDAFVRRATDYQKAQLEQTRKVNKEAGDIGRGGGTPTAAPQKMRLKDVADSMISDLSNQ